MFLTKLVVRSVFNATHFIRIASRLVGIYPYGRTFLFTALLSVYCLLGFVAFTYVFFHILLNLIDYDPVWFKNSYNRYAHYVVTCLHFGNYVISFLTSVFGVSRYQQILDEVEHSEGVLSKLKIPVGYNARDYFLLLFGPLSATWAVTLTDVGLAFAGLKSFRLFIAFLIYGSMNVCFVTKSQCISLMKALSQHFAVISDRLAFTSSSEDRLTLVKLHDHLIETSYRLNNLHSFHSLVCTGNTFGIMTIELYRLYKNLSSIEAAYSRGYGFVIALTLVIEALQMWMTVHASYTVSRKAEEFNTSLYKMMIDDRTGEIYKNEKFNLHISMKREVVFTACGFFTLDYTLIQSMIGAATTFLVILIQFDISHTSSQSSPSTDNP